MGLGGKKIGTEGYQGSLEWRGLSFKERGLENCEHDFMLLFTQREVFFL